MAEERELGQLLFTDAHTFGLQFQHLLQSRNFYRTKDFAGIYYMLIGFLSTINPNLDYDEIMGRNLKIIDVFLDGNEKLMKLFILAQSKSNGEQKGRAFIFHLDQEHTRGSFSHTQSTFLTEWKMQLNKETKDKAFKWLSDVYSKTTQISLKTSADLGNEVVVSVQRKDLNLINLLDGSVNEENMLKLMMTQNNEVLYETNEYQNQFSHDIRSFLQHVLDIYTIASDMEKLETDQLADEEVLKNSICEEDQCKITALKLELVPRYVLQFLDGALIFNFKMRQNLQIRPMMNGNEIFKLAILQQDEESWISSQKPIVLRVENIKNDVTGFISDPLSEDNLPVDFATEARVTTSFRIKVDTDTGNFQLEEFAQEIPLRNPSFISIMLHYAEQPMINELEVDDSLRKNVMEQLSRIDSFLNYKHKPREMRQFFMGNFLTETLNADEHIYALKPLIARLISDKPLDVFLIKRGSAGVVLTMSEETLNFKVSEKLASAILNTGLKQYLSVTLSNKPKKDNSIDGQNNEVDPSVGKISQNEARFYDYYWQEVKPFHEHYIETLLFQENHLMNQEDELIKMLRLHNLFPESHAEFVALIKGLVADRYPIFSPLKNDMPFIGIHIERAGTTNNEGNIARVLLSLQAHKDFQLDLQRRTSNLKEFLEAEFAKQPQKASNTMLANFVTSERNWQQKLLTYKISETFSTTETRVKYLEQCLQQRRFKRAKAICLINKNDEEEILGDKANFDSNDNKLKKRSLELAPKRSQATFRNVAKVINTAMYLQMLKGVIGSAIDGNYKGMLEHSAIIGGLIISNLLADKIIKWGQSLMYTNQLVKGGSASVGGKMLSRLYLVFVAKDFVDRIEAFKNGDSDQIVGLIGDASILVLNAVTLSLDIFATFATVEEASIEFGPAVMVAEAAIFAIVDGFYAARGVGDIEQSIKLTWGEELVQFNRLFFGAQTSNYIKQMMMQKMLNNLATGEVKTKLMQNPNIAYYAVPSLENRDANVTQVATNVANFKSLGSVHSRVWPDLKSPGLEVLCASGTNSERHSIWKKLHIITDGQAYPSYQCQNMILLRNASALQTNAVIEVGTGRDTIHGFPTVKNAFIIAPGLKSIQGGQESDTFYLTGNDTILGNLSGNGGSNVLDMQRYLLGKDIAICLTKNSLTTSGGQLRIENFTQIIGRELSLDLVKCSCNTKYLDLNGGINSSKPDLIVIPTYEYRCQHELQVKVTGFHEIINKGWGSFSYYVTETAHLLMQNNYKDAAMQKHTFFIEQSLPNIHVMKYNVSTPQFSVSTRSMKLIINGSIDNSSFIFSDGYTLLFRDGYLKAMKQICQPIDKFVILESFFMARKLKLIIYLWSNVTEEILLVSYAQHESFDSQDAVLNHLSNDASKVSHIVPGNGKSICSINPACAAEENTIQCTVPDVIIHMVENKHDALIIDLRPVYEVYSGKMIQVQLEEHVKSNSSTGAELVATIVTNNTVIGRIFIRYYSNHASHAAAVSWDKIFFNLKIMMSVKKLHNILVLIPLPLKLDKHSGVLVLTTDDVEPHLHITTPKLIGKLKCYKYENSLILSNNITDAENVLSMSKKYSKQITLLLVDYFEDKNDHIFNSLAICRAKNKLANDTRTGNHVLCSKKSLQVKKIIHGHCGSQVQEINYW